MTFDLGGLFSGVGGFMNYVPFVTDPVMSVLGADGITILESYNLATTAGLAIATPGALNQGGFRGIQRDNADIRYFRLTGASMIVHDVTTGVPEPATPLGALAGLLLFGIAAINRRRARLG
jgi:hypothetical protein